MITPKNDDVNVTFSITVAPQGLTKNYSGIHI